MDELKAVREFLHEERPASARTMAEARQRLTDEARPRPTHAPSHAPTGEPGPNTTHDAHRAPTGETGPRTSDDPSHAPTGEPSPKTTHDARRGPGGEARRFAGRRPALRRGLPRPRALVAAVAAAVMVAVAVGGYHLWTTRPLYHPEPLAGQSGPAGDFLLAAAGAKAQHITAGLLWYARTVNGRAAIVGSSREPGVRYAVEVRRGSTLISSRSANGLGKGTSATGWSDPDEQVRVRPLSAADRAAWDRDGRPGAGALGLLGGPDGARRGPIKREGAELDFGVEETRRLPADPAKLRAWLLNYATSFDHERLRDPDLYLFTNAPSLLVDRPVDDRVRIATYRILAALNGVRVVTATDADGRTGKAVAMRETTEKDGTIEWQLFVDPETGRLTASQGVVVRAGAAGLPPGTRVFSEIVEHAEWTSVPVERLEPAWVRRIDRRLPPR